MPSPCWQATLIRTRPCSIDGSERRCASRQLPAWKPAGSQGTAPPRPSSRNMPMTAMMARRLSASPADGPAGPLEKSSWWMP
eukprot:10143907-Alexandrium_andersonii.AAC.1